MPTSHAALSRATPPALALGLLVAAVAPLSGCLIVIDAKDGHHGSSYWDDDRYERSWNHQPDADLVRAASSVSVTTRAGDVTIEHTDREPAVLVRAQSASSDRIDMLTIVSRLDDDGVLELSPLWPGGWQRGDSCDLIVSLPERTPVNVETKAGDIEVSGMAGLAAAQSSAGDVEIRDHDGDVDAGSSAGDIVVEDATGGVRAATEAGDIDLERVGWPVDARTAAGDVSVLMHHGFSGVLRASTAAGSITLPGEVAMERSGSTRHATATLRPGEPMGECVFRTPAGDISVRELPLAD